MPIIRTYGDPGVLGGLAYDAGRQSGIAQRLAQQRQIDAQFVNERLRARDEIVRMESAANLANQMQGGGGYRDRPARNSTEETVNEYTRQRKAEAEKLAAKQKAEFEQADRMDRMRAALDQAYEGREKDFAYEYAMDRIKKGESLPDRMLSALGVHTTSEEIARKKAELEKGQIDTAEPKTEQERLIRRSLVQGRPDDIAGFLDQRNRKAVNFETGEAPLTNDALIARTQLQGFAESTTDKKVLEQMREALEKKKVSPEAMAPIINRIEALEREDIELKAPVAFEQAVGLFESQLSALQKKENRPLNVSERRGLLAKTLKQTADSYGLSIEQIGEFVRANDERRREAELLIEQAQAAIMQAQTAEQARQTQEQGQGQPARPEQRSPRRPDFGIRGQGME